MKKGWKIFIIVCASVFGIGVVLCIAGFAVGISDQDVRDAFRNGFTKFGIFTGHIITDSEEVTSMESQKVSDDNGKEFKGIRNLDIEVSKIAVQIKRTDEQNIRVVSDTVPEAGFQVYQEEDTLVLETAEGAKFRNNAGTIIIYIPAGCRFESAEADVGAGSLEIDALCAEDLEFSVGAGSIEADRIEAGNVTLSCGMGRIELTAAGKEQDYNYELEVGMGSVTVGAGEFGGMTVEKTIDNSAVKKMDIECGMGSVEIGFED